jgi:hypothetical protein
MVEKDAEVGGGFENVATTHADPTCVRTFPSSGTDR